MNINVCTMQTDDGALSFIYTCSECGAFLYQEKFFCGSVSTIPTDADKMKFCPKCHNLLKTYVYGSEKDVKETYAGNILSDFGIDFNNDNFEDEL